MKNLLSIAIAGLVLAFASPAMAVQDPVITVLNTATAENGPAQTLKYSFLKDKTGVHFVVDVNSGDTLIIQGRATAADAWITVKSYTADTIEVLVVPAQWRAIRSVNGGVGAATVKVINYWDLNLTAH